MQLAGLRVRLMRDADATSGYLAAIEDLKTAWRMSDADAFYRRNVAVSHANLGRAATDDAVAEEHLAEAVYQLREAVAAEGPAASDLVRLAECYETLGSIATRRGDPEATGRFDRAEQCYVVLDDHEQLSPALAIGRARNLAGRAGLLLDLGDLDGAEADLIRAVTLVAKPLEARAALTLPERNTAQRLAARVDAIRSDLFRSAGDSIRAELTHNAALKRLRKLSAQEAGADFHDYPVATQALVDLLIDHDPNAEAVAEADRALSAMLEAYPDCQQSPAWLQRRALVRWAQGDRRQAHATAGRALTIRPGDRVTRAVLAATSDTPGGDAPAEIAELRDQAPGDRRLRYWAGRLSNPQG